MISLNKLAIASALTFLAACDYVDDPVAPSVPGVGPGSEAITRRILLEDFTGQRCPNCPAAALTAQQIQTVYGEDRIIVVGVHVTQAFAEPYPPLDDGWFDTDFRTPAGNDYENALGISFLPVGAINRRNFGRSVLQSHGNWSSCVAQLIDTPVSMDLWFDTLEYDASANEVNCTVKLAAAEALTGEHKLVVYLTEDHVIDDQIDNTQTPPEVPDYDHRHVLRDNLNGSWGETIIATGAAVGDTLELSYTRPLASNVLEPDNCALVAYVYNTTTGEVLQVADRKFQP